MGIRVTLERKEEIIKKFIAFLLIIALTMVDFALIGAEILLGEQASYAVDGTVVGTATNNKNVIFDAYFKDANGTVLTSKEESISNEDMKLYVQVVVINGGYFNGEINIGESNFRLKNEIKSNSINKIDGNTITLNQINSDEVAEIELGIEAIKDDTISSGLLNMTSKIAIKGTYRDSKEKDIDIKATREVQLVLQSPYTENEGMEITSAVITNKVYKINEKEKRVVQVLVESGLEGNRYPIKENKIEVEVPEGVEEVDVIARGKQASNGKEEKEFGKENWTYKEAESKVEIAIKNEEENQTIKWEKSGKDRVVVTYIMKAEANLEGKEIAATSKITMYDTKGTEKAGIVVAKIEGEKDGIITTGIGVEERSIYKGKIYSGEDREYKERTNIYVNSKKTGKDISIEKLASTYEATEGVVEANIEFVSTKINKEEVTRVLGTEGTLKILTLEGTEVVEINGETEADKEGKVTVSYPAGIKGIKIETTEVKGEGTITIESTKKIKADENSREIKRKYTGIKERVTGAEGTIELKETETKVKIEANKTTWSTLTKNDNVQITATLLTNDEKYDLYKNPTINIYLPQEIKDISINGINKMYADEMEIESARFYPSEKRIEIKLKGEQTQFRNDLTEGIKLVIDTDIILEKNQPTKNTVIKTIVTNENRENEVTLEEKEIQISSKKGVLLYESIEGYNNSNDKTETITSETVDAKLEMEAEEKQAKIQASIVNNYDESMTNVILLGKLPNLEKNSTIETDLLSTIKADNQETKVYYSTENTEIDSDKWTENVENINDIKMFKIQMDEVEPGEIVNITYPVLVPGNLEENAIANEELVLNYNYSGQELSTSASIRLASPVQVKANVDEEVAGQTFEEDGLVTNVVAVSANRELQDGEEISNGQTVSYTVKITNYTGKDLNNLKMIADHSNVTYYGEVRENGMYYEEDPSDILVYIRKVQDLENITKTEETLKAGETITYKYEFVPRKDKGNEVTGSIRISADDLEEQTISTITNPIKDAELAIDVLNAYNDNMVLYNEDLIRLQIDVENFTDEDKKDVILKMYTGNMQFSKETFDADSDINGNISYVKQSSSDNNVLDIKLKSLPKNSTTSIALPFIIKCDTENSNISTYCTITTDTETYYSNTFYKDFKKVGANIDAIQVADVESETVKMGDMIVYTAQISNLDETEDINDMIIEHTVTGGNSKIVSAYIENEYGEQQQIEVNSRDTVSSIYNLKAGQTINYVAEVIIEEDQEYNYNFTNPATSNISLNLDNGKIIGLNEISKTIDLEESNQDDEEDDNKEENNDNNNDNQDNENNNYEEEYEDFDDSSYSYSTDDGTNSSTRDSYLGSISGVAWIDNNRNGIKDDNEFINQMTVNLLNSRTGEIIKTTKTNENGEYNFTNLESDTYMVAFMYDNSTYQLTQYKVDNASESENSDVITKENYAITNEINVNGNSIYNIDAGFCKMQIFDLSLQKTISRVTIKTAKDTKVKEYNDQSLVKVEIHRKQIQNAVVQVEYKIKVTNEGELAGYANRIIDYIPKDMVYSPQNGNDWVLSSNNIIYSDALSNTLINPGESKELILIMTKNMNEENTGITINQAEIDSSSNDYNISDKDSIAGNKKDGEDDISTANIIISISTGVGKIILLTLGILIILTSAGFIVYKNKKEV